MSRVLISPCPCCLSVPEDIDPGIQMMNINTNLLYSSSGEHYRFEMRLREFLKADAAGVITYRDGILYYLTESVTPVRTDSRVPLLLLFGNPAPDSVQRKCFFAGEKGGREHRFWLVLERAGIIAFEKTGVDANTFRTRALFDLEYRSPFRIGLAVFYSMPSPASDPKWSGVAGLHRLFGARALREIAECEKRRVDALMTGFISGNPSGAVVAFQKDAYSAVKDDGSLARVIADDGKWRLLEARCSSSGTRLLRMPPTRYMNALWYIEFLRLITGLLGKQPK